jgi:predicted protein tyrosine phosphatase
MLNKVVYKVLCLTRNEKILSLVNKICNTDNYNMIIPNLYLGNIKSANDEDFLKKNNITAIVNCTENEPYHTYFNNKPKLRLAVQDSKEEKNMEKFKVEIIKSINFIEKNISENKPVYVHCYWGLMRSATVVAGYLIKKYNISHIDAINIVKEKRPSALSSLYNFNEILEYLEKLYVNK